MKLLCHMSLTVLLGLFVVTRATPWHSAMAHRWEQVVRHAVRAPDTRSGITRMHASPSGGGDGNKSVVHPLLREDETAKGDSTPHRPNMTSIINGYRARKWVAKHLVYLTISFHESPRTEICTGTVISPFHVLTAAHCLNNFGKFDVSNVEMTVGSRPRSGKKYTARFIHVHKDFIAAGRGAVMNDIAIIWIDGWFRRSVGSGAYLADSLPAPRTKVYAAGYGIDGSDSFPSRLQEVPLRYQRYRICAKRESRRARSFFVRDALVCATDRGFPSKGESDTCLGDSGGPLFDKHGKGRRTIVVFGITSFGTNNCATAGFGGWYTNVPHFYEDIAAHYRRDFRKWNEVYRVDNN